MKANFKKINHIDLQLFAEGGAAGASGTSAGSDGASANGADSVNTGDNTAVAESGAEEVAAQKEDRASLYAKFKEDYKAEYDADVQKIIKARLNKANAFANKTKPLFETLATKYGVSPDDIDTILKAVEDDDSYFSEKALEAGMTVDDYKERTKLQREVERYRAEEQRRNEEGEKAEVLERLNAQIADTKKMYPNFDIKVESSNPEFSKLVSKGVDVKTAYEVVHKDEIITAAMQTAVQKSEEKISASIASNRSRPNENGMNAQASATSTIDVNNLSREQIADYKKRALAGEKITFRK